MSAFRDEIDALLNEGIRLATEFLEQNKQFYPFALRLTEDGGIDLVQAELGEAEPDSGDLIVAVEETLREMAVQGEIIAGVVISDVFVSQDGSDESTDAIQLALEHAQGISVECFLPYRWENESLKLGELFSQQAEPAIFLPTESDGPES
ncbi:MAG: hypothetical protein NVSMB14_00040 [Isosphaeraceae bacterium]